MVKIRSDNGTDVKDKFIGKIKSQDSHIKRQIVYALFYIYFNPLLCKTRVNLELIKALSEIKGSWYSKI